MMLGFTVGTSLANDIILKIQAILNTGGLLNYALKNWIEENPHDWQDSIRDSCRDMMESFFKTQTQVLAWAYSGSCIERTRCNKLTTPVLTPQGIPASIALALNLKITESLGIGIEGNLTYNLISEGNTFFHNSLSEEIVTEVPTSGMVLCAADGELTVSLTAATDGILEIAIQATGTSDTQDVVGLASKPGEPNTIEISD